MEKHELAEGKVDWKGRQAIKHKHGGIRTSLLILGTFGVEQLATIALAVNLVTYFTQTMHFDLADAANELTNFMGTSYLLSILVALLADTYLGRWKAIMISGFFEILALILLAVQARYSNLKPPPCNIFVPNSVCEKIGGSNAVLLFVSLYLLALGSGGLKAVLPSFGADQFDEKEPKEANQMSSFFNYLLVSICVGGVISLTLLVRVQDKKGWDWGFGLSAIAMLLSMLIFSVGLPLYRIQTVQGSNPVIEIIQVYVAAIRNRKLQLPENPSELYEINKDSKEAVEAEFQPHTDSFSFLDRAAIVTTSTEHNGRPEALNPWKLCRVTQVENGKTILGVIPIFCSTFIMTLCLAQLQTFSIQQGVTMDTSITKSFDIPPATLPIIPFTFMIILLPIYDQVFVPFARKITGHPSGITHLQRIGVGLILSSISMAAAALMEGKRKQVARDHNMLDAIPMLQPVPISTMWLSIQYCIFGLADMFTYVGLLEFFYSQAPKRIKSISTCFLWISMAIGYYLSSIMVNIVNAATKNITRSGGWLAGNNINRNHLNLFYWLLSALSFINFCAYLIFAKRYKYRTLIHPVDSEDKSLV
ncbi:protein NRT1/ PTR FAMILY 4.5-like [Euphorbia lathyris]|uniref:protein NRT1/ PTR FAMILY 4.5-like n=1 Tax=Euphorbia lathyris TaxID=212925 RepID=UPI0033143518